MNSILLLGIILQIGLFGHACKDACAGVFITAASTRAKCCKTPKCPSVWGWLDGPGPIQAVEYYAANKKVGVDPSVLVLRDFRDLLFEKEGCRTVRVA